MHVHVSIYIYIYMYVYVYYMYMKARFDIDGQIVRCTWVWKRKTNRTISQLILPAVFLRTIGAQQCVEVKRMIWGIGDVPCSTCSQTLNGYDPRVSLVNT